MSTTAGAVDEEHVFMGVRAVAFVLIVFTCLLISYVFKRKRFHMLPDSSAALLLGFFAGGATLAMGANHREYAMFRQEVFYFLLLPPILFDAGFNVEKSRFFRNLPSIMLFAVIGTLISTFVIGYGLYGLACAGLVGLETSSALESLMVGALISAVDPVATLSILANKHVNADKLLTSLVFGESVLNDAVSIVLFNTLREFYAVSGSLVTLTMRDVIVRFVELSLSSVGVGLFVALLASLILRKTPHLPDTHQFALVFLFAYLSYSLAEVLGMSGVMALFFCGICMSHYGWYSMSKSSRIATVSAFRSFALISETFIFAYLGMAAVVSLHPSYHLHWSFAMIFFTTILCLLSRALNIFPLAWVANLGRRRKIPGKMQVVMWFAGLRGAIAFALALSMPTTNASTVETTTMTIVVLTSLVCGGLTEPLLSSLGLKRGIAGGGGGSAAAAGVTADAASGAVKDDDDAADTESDDDASSAAQGLYGSAASLAYTLVSASAHHVLPERYSRTVDAGLQSVWHRFDVEFLQPIFGGAAVARSEAAAAALASPPVRIELQTASRRTRQLIGDGTRVRSFDDDDLEYGSYGEQRSPAQDVGSATVPPSPSPIVQSASWHRSRATAASADAGADPSIPARSAPSTPPPLARPSKKPA